MANVYLYSGAAGAGTGADWTNAFTTLAAAITGAGSGGTIWVASDHNEAAGSATTWAFGSTAGNPLKLLSVNRAGSTPPVAADALAGAIQSTSGGNFAITLTGNVYAWGVYWKPGLSASGAAAMSFGAGGGQTFVLENCRIEMSSTGSSNIQVNNSTSVQLINTVIKHGNTGNKIGVGPGRICWRDTSGAIDNTGSIPTQLLTSSTALVFQLERLDLSALNSADQLIATTNVVATALFVKDCKFGSSFTPGAWNTMDGGAGFMSRCGSSSNDDNTVSWFEGALRQTDDKILYRHGGASYDGSVPFSWKLVPLSNNSLQAKARGADIEVYNTLTGAGRTVTIYGIANVGASIPTNNDIWLEACALLDSTSPVKTTVSSGIANPLTAAANVTADSSDWDDGIAARANTTAYVTGDRIALASNPGRVFFCTAGGTSAGSEPAGYASAVDGGAVTDGGATFRAGWRFSITVTLGTINRAGLVIAWVRIGSTTTTNQYWVDPDIVIA
jgi:hypothetical protein